MRTPGRGLAAPIVLTAAGPDRRPELEFTGCGGATARFTCDAPPRVPIGALDSMALAGPRLDRGRPGADRLDRAGDAVGGPGDHSD